MIIRFFKKAATLIFVAALFCGAFIVYQGYDMYSQGLKKMSLEEMRIDIQTKPVYTRLDDLPHTYRDAVIAVEDKRFYKHPGVDPIAIARAVYNDIKAGSLVQGGSTITQQLAKNVYFDQEKHFTRKIAEVFMALKMEQRFTKNEILELYLNSIYFGNGYNSVGEASRGYFAKAPMQLNEDECIMLAGIPNAPSVYNPVDNPQLAVKRQEQVRAQMIEAGFLSAGEHDDGAALPLGAEKQANTAGVIDTAHMMDGAYTNATYANSAYANTTTNAAANTATNATNTVANANEIRPAVISEDNYVQAASSSSDKPDRVDLFFTQGCDFLSSINPDWKILQDFYKYIKELAECVA